MFAVGNDQVLEPNKRSEVNTPAFADTLSRNDARSSRVTVLASTLMANCDHFAVSSGFEGGRSRRVTRETFRADKPCSNGFRAGPKSLGEIYRWSGGVYRFVTLPTGSD